MIYHLHNNTRTNPVGCGGCDGGRGTCWLDPLVAADTTLASGCAVLAYAHPVLLMPINCRHETFHTETSNRTLAV